MKKYWYFDLIHKYIAPDSKGYPYYIIHSSFVAQKAIRIAKKLKLKASQITFIEEAAMLHDIGICQVESEFMGTSGGPYITHGIIGSQILKKEGYPKHARVAESHNGTGLYKQEIIERNLPLPKRDFVPKTIEEKIISYADLFYSKSEKHLWQERTLQEVRELIAKYGLKHNDNLEDWIKKFE